MDWQCVQCTLLNGVLPDAAAAVVAPYADFERFARFKGAVIREEVGAFVECAACDTPRAWRCSVPMWYVGIYFKQNVLHHDRAQDGGGATLGAGMANVRVL